MTLIVDGYNLYFTGLRPGDDPHDIRRARDLVIDRVSRYTAGRRTRALIFFDGGPAGQHMPRVQRVKGVELRFSDPRLDADNDIKHAVANWHNNEELRVITSDGNVARFVKRLGATVTSSQDFAAELNALFEEKESTPRDEPIEKYQGADRAEVDYWLRRFTQRKKPGGESGSGGSRKG